MILYKMKNLHLIKSMQIKFHNDILDCHTAPYPQSPVAFVSAPAEATNTRICLNGMALNSSALC